MILRIDSEPQGLYVFMTAPDTGCAYSGYPGTIFMQSVSTDGVSSATGMAVRARGATQRYWHADLPLGSS